MTSPAIHFRAKKLLILGLVILFFLNIGNAVSLYAIFVKKLDFALGIVPLFNMDLEANLPSTFNGVLLLWGALLAFPISSWQAHNGESQTHGWKGVGCILTFLFLDELCGIHEALDFILMARLKTDGVIAWPWVIPYGLLAVAIAGFFMRFYFRLDRREQVIFAGSAALYVASAIGMEMWESSFVETHGEGALGYGLLYTIEENGEMLAVILANFGMMRVLVEHCEGFGGTLRFSS